MRLAVPVVLILGLSGCATFAEVTPREWAERPLEEEQVDAAAPAPVPARQDEPPAEPSKPAHDVKAEEIRTPLKDALLAALESSKRQKQPHVVKPGDSLAAIAKRYQATLEMLKWANRLKTDHIHPGQKLVIPAAALRIEIDKSENRLRLFNDLQLVRVYPVATGDQGVTPTGNYTVANRLIQPTWYWQGYAVPPGDPEYPLGTRWLGLSKRGYGIHGTNEPESIGKQISHGCIRMHNEDVEELFEVVAVGTAVAIVE
jgi:lipoprotein-anchoring transpeptidase ErfK/SrfK